MALVIIFAVLSQFDFVAKFTVKNLNKDFTNTDTGGGGVTILWKFFIKPYYFLKDGFPNLLTNLLTILTYVWEGAKKEVVFCHTGGAPLTYCATLAQWTVNILSISWAAITQ